MLLKFLQRNNKYPQKYKIINNLNNLMEHLHLRTKRNETMKDPAFLSSPIYLPILPSKPSLSTNRNDYLIPLLSHDRFIFKSQLTSL